MYSEIRTVTPDTAREWLTVNTDNRPVSGDKVRSIAGDIRRGSFATTHQGIAFSGTPKTPQRLLDGQKRLLAVVEANMPITVVVWWGVDDTAWIGG